MQVSTHKRDIFGSDSVRISQLSNGDAGENWAIEVVVGFKSVRPGPSFILFIRGDVVLVLDEPDDIFGSDVPVKGLKFSYGGLVEVVLDNVVVEDVAMVVLIHLHVGLTDCTAILSRVKFFRVSLNNDGLAEEAFVVGQGTIRIVLLTKEEGTSEAGVFNFACLNVRVGKICESTSISVVLVGVVSKNNAIFAFIFVGGFVAVSGTSNNQIFLGLSDAILKEEKRDEVAKYPHIYFYNHTKIHNFS